MMPGAENSTGSASPRVPEGFRRAVRRGNRRNRARVKTLRRMLAYCETLLAAGANLNRKDRLRSEVAALLTAGVGREEKDRLRSEISALAWVIDVAEEWIGEDPLVDVDWRDPEFVDTAELQDILDLLGTVVTYMEARFEVVNVQFVTVDAGRAVRLTLRPLLPDGPPAQRPTKHRFLGVDEVWEVGS